MRRTRRERIARRDVGGVQSVEREPAETGGGAAEQFTASQECGLHNLTIEFC